MEDVFESLERLTLPLIRDAKSIDGAVVNEKKGFGYMNVTVEHGGRESQYSLSVRIPTDGKDVQIVRSESGMRQLIVYITGRPPQIVNYSVPTTSE